MINTVLLLRCEDAGALNIGCKFFFSCVCEVVLVRVRSFAFLPFFFTRRIGCCWWCKKGRRALASSRVKEWKNKAPGGRNFREMKLASPWGNC